MTTPVSGLHRRFDGRIRRFAGTGEKDGHYAASFRRLLLLSAAAIALGTAMADICPAFAQSVSGTGDLSPGTGTIQTPDWMLGSDLFVGQSGTGTLTIQDGGTVENSTGIIGFGAGAQGTVTVVGADPGGTNTSTWINNGDLVVGQDGNGTLNIENGGRVSNDYGYIGAGGGSQGDVLVSGHDTNGNASTWTNAGELKIGDIGRGSLTISDGGVVNSALGSVGVDSAGNGAVTVSGRDVNGNASTWNVANQIYVGDGGLNNTLDIQNGGVVNSGQGIIGYQGGSEGAVTVSGGDINGNASAWNAANNIYVGFSGDGTLDVEDGAKVSTSAVGGGAATVYIGYMDGGTGAVNVSSSNGNVSSLTATDRIEVGSSGSGTLTVENGGFVRAASDVHIASSGTASGTLHLNGGVVETGSVIKGLGTAGLDLNGGMLRANRNENNFLNGFDVQAIGAGGVWFDSNTYDIMIGTDFSGTSSLNKLGLGQLTLTGDSSGFSGAAMVSAGTLAVNGVLGGSMAVDVAGRLVGTGQVGGTTNSGIVAPGYGNAMGVLTIQGDYASTGGRLEIATVLGDDSSQTSRLVIDGATSGVTQVGIVNRGGVGAQTVEGIRIVEVTGVSSGHFVLDGDYIFEGAPAVVAGAYAYRLYQGGVSTPTDGDWYLRSALLDADPSGPLYQPGVPIYEAYAANLQSLNALPTLQQRVGNRSWAAGANPEGSGIWGRVEGAHGHFNPAVSTSDSDQDIDRWKMQVGADRVMFETEKGERLVGGITATYGEASSHIRSIFGDGSLKTGGYGLGATLTWYGRQGFYLDGQAHLSRYRSDLNSDPLGVLTQNNHGRGEALSLEVGKRISVVDKLSVTPQFQMAYSNVRFDQFVDTADAIVTADSGDSFKTRWGLTVDHQSAWEGGRSHIYGIVNLTYEWLGPARTLVSGTPIEQADERLWGELGLGASVNWRDDLAFYGEISGSTPFHDVGDSYSLGGNVGLRRQF